MSVRCFFYLVITAYCASILPCLVSLNPQYEYCRNSSKCGNTNLTHPFGVGKRGCGLLAFQIDCVNNSTPVIAIDGQRYTILRFDDPILIVKGDSCQFLTDPINMEIPSSQSADAAIKITGKENRTLYVYKCAEGFKSTGGLLSQCGSSNVYYAFSDPGHSIQACSMEKLLIEVGKADWVISERQRYGMYASCDASGGICGYNTSASTAPFVCYCKDGPQAHKCPSDGCFFGGALLAAAIAAVLFTYYARKRRKSHPCTISKVEKFLEEYAYEMPTRYSFDELKRMTNNFVEKLGEGGFGLVYKGKLLNGTLVAVKLLDRTRHSETQFMNEVATIGRIHHVNLVRLLGFCYENLTSALVYEYMVNGFLEKFIFEEKKEEQVLGFKQLYLIALGAARGIAYLHEDCDQRIVHFDIKPHNILLDAEFRPKVSDFGLAKLCGKGDDHISMTVARGTPGYAAPEVFNRDMGVLTDKSDVYSFGMLLLEIVRGRKNFDSNVSHSSQFYFPHWVFKTLDNGELGKTLTEGKMDAEDVEKARSLIKVGLWCIQYNYIDRPCMSKVVQMIEGHGDDVANPPSAFMFSSPAPEIASLYLFSSIEESCSIRL
eukprot:PITA_05575